MSSGASTHPLLTSSNTVERNHISLGMLRLLPEVPIYSNPRYSLITEHVASLTHVQMVLTRVVQHLHTHRRNISVQIYCPLLATPCPLTYLH